MEEQVKEELDKIVADILRDVSGVDALRYYTDKILDTIEAERQEDRREGRREVVEWVHNNTDDIMEDLPDRFYDNWQNQLRKWGIKGIENETANL